jgi:3-oxoadipate enol-lactonase
VGEVLRELSALAVPVDGGRLHAVVAAPRDADDDTSTVVLGHGAGGCHLAFASQVEHLSSRHRVVAWDQRGFGGSHAVPEAGPEVAAHDLLAVLDAAGVRAAHLVGQSLGGWACVRAAMIAPERVRSVVLSASVGGMLTPATAAPLDRFVRDTEASAGAPSVLGRSPTLAPASAAQAPVRTVLHQLLGRLPGPGTGPVRRIRATSYDVGAVAALGVPILFLTGEHDVLAPPDEVARLAARLPSARSVTLPGVGHSPHVEAPHRVGELLEDFVAEVEERAGRRRAPASVD